MSKRKTHEEFIEEVSGRSFTVIGKYVKQKAKVLFKCSVCENEWKATPSNILSGQGCPPCNIKIRNERSRGSNEILKDYGSWVLIDISTPKYPNTTSKMDRIDFDKIGSRINLNNGGYPTASFCGVKTMIHKILNPEYKVTDHINRDKTDNRRFNLRECTRRQNVMNCSLGINNISGVTGVCYRGNINKWCAQIMINGKNINLGYFNIKQNAIIRRRLAELNYFKEFAPY